MKMAVYRYAVTVLGAILGLGMIPAVVGQAVTNRVNPLADSYVNSGSATSNFGTSTNFFVRTNQVAGTQTTYGFLKFGVSGISNVGTASLRVYSALWYTGLVQVAAYSVADTNWSETGITWNNMPPASNLLASLQFSHETTSSAGKWYEFDVTSFILGEVAAGRTFVTFSLVNLTNTLGNTANYARIHPKEITSVKPELAWTTNEYPTVSITSPVNGALVQANVTNVTINATASDSDGTIYKVDFYVDGVLLATDHSSPYSMTWSNRVLGVHSLVAKAMDNKGAEVSSSTFYVTNTHSAIDADLNGTSDILEDVTLANSAQFMATPFVVTGAIEAEQFDKGGQNVGYYSATDNATTDYRNTRVSIEEVTNDIGAGFMVTKLKQGDWLKYSFQVRTAGYYTIEARVSAVATGGTFKAEFANANSTANYQTPAITIAQTNWHYVSYAGLYLTAGSNSFKLLMNSTNSSADGYVGKFNYVSIYPTIIPNTFPAYTNVVTGLYTDTGTNFAYAQLNSRILQHSVSNVLRAGGGVVKIPAGTYYFAQNPDWCNQASGWEQQNNSVGMSSCVRLWTLAPPIGGGQWWPVGSNIKITGDSATNTFLKAQNRSATLFFAGDGWYGGNQTWTNITFENLTFEGAPHTRTNGLFEPGAFSTFDTNNWGGGPSTIGSLIVALGKYDYPLIGVNIQNCIFKNARNPVVLADIEKLIISSNRFLFFTGEYPSGLGVSNVLVADGVTYDHSTGDIRLTQCHVGILSGGGSGSYGIRNALVTDNYFNGTVTGDGIWSTNASGELVMFSDTTDGLVWFSWGGNWFVSRNTVENYFLEGTSFQGGPLAMVGNTFDTFQYTGSTCAFQLCYFFEERGVTTSSNDLSYCFIGNDVRGGRTAVLGGNYQSAWDESLYDLHVCGNDVDVDPPSPILLDLLWDWFGAVASVDNTDGVNMSGNILRGVGQGYRSTMRSVSAEIHKNDFTAATTNAISFQGPGTNTLRIVISKNSLGQGGGVHLHATNDYPGLFWSVPATNIFLIKDSFYDGALVPVSDPVTKPANYPVNIQY